MRGTTKSGNPQAGVTLIEILIAVTLLSLLSLGILVAMQLGLSTMDKTDRRIVSNRRVTGARRILEGEINGFIFSKAKYHPTPDVFALVPFFEARNQSMRFVTSYSLTDAWRGRPQIVEMQVIPGQNNEGVRLIVNEVVSTGPDQSGQFVLSVGIDPVLQRAAVQYAPIVASSQSFVLADRLAYCRFSYLEDRQLPRFPTWIPDWTSTTTLPIGVRVDMAPLDHSLADLHETAVTIPFRVSRLSDKDYVD